MTVVVALLSVASHHSAYCSALSGGLQCAVLFAHVAADLASRP